MTGLVPVTHVHKRGGRWKGPAPPLQGNSPRCHDVDGRDKPGHDDRRGIASLTVMTGLVPVIPVVKRRAGSSKSTPGHAKVS